MKKKPVNEGLFTAAKKFTDAFFDGLKANAADRMIRKAQKQGMPSEVTDLMNKIQKDKDELDALLDKISKA